jgi:hypothetical protein
VGRVPLRILMIVVLALWLAAASEPGTAAAPSDLPAFFPLTPGTVRVYRTNTGSEVARRVGGVQRLGGQECRVIETLLDGRVTQTECYRVTDDGVYVVQRSSPEGAVALVPPQRLLAAPVAVGRTWQWTGTIADRRVVFDYQWARRESTATPAGTFDAMQLYFQGQPGPGAVIQAWRWFARDVGLVKEDTLVTQGGQQQRGYLELVRIIRGQ